MLRKVAVCLCAVQVARHHLSSNCASLAHRDSSDVVWLIDVEASMYVCYVIDERRTMLLNCELAVTVTDP